MPPPRFVVFINTTENLRVRNTLTEEFCLRAGFKRMIHRMLLHVQETRLRRLLIRPPQLAVCLEIRVSGPCVAFPGQLLSLCFWLPAATKAGESFSPQQTHLLKWCSQTTELNLGQIFCFPTQSSQHSHADRTSSRTSQWVSRFQDRFLRRP